MTKRPRARGIAAVYCRVSRDREGGGLAVERQELDCRPLCERRGYAPESIRLYVDNDLSAYSGKRRPGYTQLLEDVKAGGVTFITAWHNDRLHRSPLELEEFIATIEGSGVDVETARAGILDLTTPSGRMMARQLGSVARFESEHKAERQRAKHRELALAGKSSGGGNRPFGYVGNGNGAALVKAEAAVIREVAGRVLAGESMRAVVADVNARGIRSTRNHPFDTTSLRNILVGARISGRREHGRRSGAGMLMGTITGPATWPAIISAEDSDRLRRLFANPERRTGSDNLRRYLLTGMVVCGRCGTKLLGRARDRRPSMTCPGRVPGRYDGCGGVKIYAEPLEELICAAVVGALDGGLLAAAMRRDDSAALGDLARVDAQLAELAEAWGRGAFSRGEWEAARRPLLRRRADAERRAAEQSGTTALVALPSPLTRDVLRALPLSRRRAIVSAVIAEVTVNTAVRGRHVFDPGRIDVRWRDEVAQ